MPVLSCDPGSHPAGRCACLMPRRALLRGAAAALGAATLPAIPAGAQAPARPGPGQRRIDIHHHLTPPAYRDAALAKLDLPPVARNWTPARTIEDLDRAGIDVAILSVTTPAFTFVEGEERRRLVRACNEYAAGLAQQFPRRLGFFAALPLPDIEGSLAETAHALDALKADGVYLFTNYDNRWLGDQAFHPLYEELERRRAVAATHPISAACCTNLLPGIPDTVVEFGTDTTRSIASLMFSGTAARFPGIRFVFSHAGGTMPFLIERLEFQARPPAVSRQLAGGAVLPALARFHYDTAQAANPVAMAALLKVVPAGQVLLGTDFPYRLGSEQVQGLAGSGLAPETLRAIESGNAEALLPRLRP
ncbi:amidohydrolase [Roseomonas sp. NAR14]|uniref:Amidohydrolase n=1 Tax=Roseomonas acroporae TaxID=2937791 RepID=A0A9X1Y492_9PROT|nr:amidohydrolase family protein [Roseomonas acroporae]MCK8782857.1 amidohydrolase [Roseomonas acroporae]